MRTRLTIACCLLALLPGRTVRVEAQSADAVDAPRISQQDFKTLIAAKNVVIIDTRNAEAFPAARIPGAVLLPLEGQLTWPASYETVVAMLLKTKKQVVTYCA